MKSITHHLRNAALSLTGSGQTKRVMMQFARKSGLIYFGAIDSAENGDHLIRGITLTMPGKDSHYSFGSHDSYDIACVQRVGVANFPDRKSTNHSWVVMQFDLHTASPLPHVLIGRRDQAQLLYASLLSIQREMSEHVFAEPDSHHKNFAKQFITLASPAHAGLVEHVVSPEFTSAIVGHFKNLMIEIEDDSLYLFIDDPRPTLQSLDKMLHYGLVCAKHVDERMGA